MTTPEMTCPKCRNTMRTYERNGINIDQCTECRGIFLDRGELEHLLDAEAAFSTSPAPVASPASQQAAPAPGWTQGGHHGKSSHGGQYQKRRKSFLGELFD